MLETDGSENVKNIPSSYVDSKVYLSHNGLFACFYDEICDVCYYKMW